MPSLCGVVPRGDLLGLLQRSDEVRLLSSGTVGAGN